MTENWKYWVTTGIALLGLFLSSVGLYLNHKTNSQVALDRINRINLSQKYDRVLVGTDDIEYSVDITNGSDLNIYEVTIFAPEDIREMYNGTISMDEEGRPRGYYIGDMAPSIDKKIKFKLINSKDAQLNEFKMKFKTTSIDSEDQWWIKESGKVAKKIKN